MFAVIFLFQHQQVIEIKIYNFDALYLKINLKTTYLLTGQNLTQFVETPGMIYWLWFNLWLKPLQLQELQQIRFHPLMRTRCLRTEI